MAERKSEAKRKGRAISGASATRVREALRNLTPDQRAGLFPPHIDKVREMTSLELRPGDADTYAALLETICGATDDSQPVEQYDGTLGVTRAFVDAHQGPVGQLQWNSNLASVYTHPGDVSGVRWCSGTLISNDLFLAAGHCFDQAGGGWTRPTDNTTGATITPAQIATNMHVNFNYQVDPSGNLRAEQSFAITELVEYRLGGLDFSIARLSGNPGATYGITGVSTTDAAAGDMLCIIGHPAGWPKRIEAGPALAPSGDTISYNDIDTLGGNSGSGILRASDGRIVGVHTNGGCNAAGTGSNSGVRITSILAQSPTLRALTTPKLKFVDEHPTILMRDTLPMRDRATIIFLDRRPTLKFIDDPKPAALDTRGTYKGFDDTKMAGLDKQFNDRKLPGMETTFDPGRFGDPYAAGGGTPFVLSTPHHSMEWTAAGGTSGVEALQQYEEALVQIETALQQLYDQMTALDAEYRRMLAEYEQLSTQG